MKQRLNGDGCGEWLCSTTGRSRFDIADVEGSGAKKGLAVYAFLLLRTLTGETGGAAKYQYLVIAYKFGGLVKYQKVTL